MSRNLRCKFQNKKNELPPSKLLSSSWLERILIVVLLLNYTLLSDDQSQAVEDCSVFTHEEGQGNLDPQWNSGSTLSLPIVSWLSRCQNPLVHKLRLTQFTRCVGFHCRPCRWRHKSQSCWGFLKRESVPKHKQSWLGFTTFAQVDLQGRLSWNEAMCFCVHICILWYS